MHSASPARTPKLQLTAEQPSTGECWIPTLGELPPGQQQNLPQEMLPLLSGGGGDGLPLTRTALEPECLGQRGLCQLHLRGLDTVSQPACTPSSLSVKWGRQHPILGLRLRQADEMLLALWWMRSGYLINEAVTSTTGHSLKTQWIKLNTLVERNHRV